MSKKLQVGDHIYRIVENECTEELFVEDLTVTSVGSKSYDAQTEDGKPVIILQDDSYWGTRQEAEDALVRILDNCKVAYSPAYHHKVAGWAIRHDLYGVGDN